MKRDRFSLKRCLAEVCAAVFSAVQQVQVQDPERESYHPYNYSLQVGRTLVFVTLPA